MRKTRSIIDYHTHVRALLCMVLCSLAAGGWAAVREITLSQNYLAAGTMAHGKVLLHYDGTSNARLRVSLFRTIDVADAGPSSPATEILLDRLLTGKPGDLTIAFAIAAGRMLFGRVQIKAEEFAGSPPYLVSTALSPSIPVGVRRRINLVGDWKVAQVKLLPGDLPLREANWTMPSVPSTIHLPGALPFDHGFRGWVTLQREIQWPRTGDLAPRALYLFGASDSARVRINSMDIGETAPADEAAIITHWVEFHAPPSLQGPEHADTRRDLVAGGTDDPSTLTFSRPLPPTGKATIEMTLRATSGGFADAPVVPYGVLNDVQLELAPALMISGATFDTRIVNERRRFIFRLQVRNDTGAPFLGRLRTVYGRYTGDHPYSGACPPVAEASEPVRVLPGECTLEVQRDERPRFDTCRATFLLLNDAGRVLDAATQNYHTVVVEIRNRRDLYLNNERFIFKGQMAQSDSANTRMQLLLMGANGFRGHGSVPSCAVRGLMSEAELINARYADGLLTSAGSALLASCERCAFWDPQDHSNIDKAVRHIIRCLASCPGIIDWEATNELYGESDETRIAILDAFHRYDPYHRPVLATKSAEEWEAVAHDGRVPGVDIVGCQYLLSAEALDSITAAVSEQPIWSTEVNWNEPALYNDQQFFARWLNKGISGSLLFDYGRNALDQPVPLMPPADHAPDVPDTIIRSAQRALYQDLTAGAQRLADGHIVVRLGNRMPFRLTQLKATVPNFGTLSLSDLAPGDEATINLPADAVPVNATAVTLKATYFTHAGLRHLLLLTPAISGGAL